MSHPIGQQLGNYRLVRLLGRGGFARVYLGEHVHLKTFAAVKVLDIEVIDNNEQEDFLTEARNIANLRHPNIVRVLDFDVKDRTPFLVMDYAPNGSLAAHHPKASPLPFPTIVSYIKQVAAALQFAHDQARLIHCDVKPANMLLGANHEVLLSDFGIALVAPGSRAASMERAMGTLAYMAPEHLNRRPVLASDQYSLAVVAYEWLCGDLPFHGSPAELCQQHLLAPPPSLRKKIPSLPFAVEQVVQRALEKDPQQRFLRVQDFAIALEEAVSMPSLLHHAERLVLAGAQASTPPDSAAAGQAAQEPIFVGPSTEPVSPSALTQATPPPMPGPHPHAPRIPLHPLLQQQHELIRRFYSLLKTYEWRKNGQQRQRDEERSALAKDRRRAIGEADQEVQALRQRIEEVRFKVRRSGWIALTADRTSTTIPPTIAVKNNPSRQVAAWRSSVDELRGIIDTFLTHYPRTSNLLTLSVVFAGIAAAILAVLAGLVFPSAGGIIAAVLVALLVFIVGGSAFFLFQFLPLRRACAALEGVASGIERLHREQSAALEDSYNQRLSDLEGRYDQSIALLEQALQEQSTELRFTFASFINTTGFSGLDWHDPLWQQWKLQSAASPVTRIGTLAVGAQLGFPSLPALVFCPGGCNLLLKVADMSKASAVSAVQALALRLVATQPPGKLHFTLVDPAGLGQNVSTISQLADPDKMLGTYQAWVDDQEIEQQLRALTRHIRDINSKLRGQYTSLEAYNQARGEHAEPYRILIVMDFPANFTPRAARDLLTILQNGPRCGLSTIIVSSMSPGAKRSSRLSPSFDLQELEKVASVITWNGHHFTWQDPDFQRCQFELDTLPQQSLVNHILQAAGRNSSTPVVVEQNPLFKDVLLNLRWRAPRENVKVWLGHPVASRQPTAFSFHRQGGGNLLILGKQEEAAISMLITAMMSMAAQCSPQTARFYLLDLSVVDAVLAYVPNAGPLEFVTHLLQPYAERIINRRALRAQLSSLITEIGDMVEDRLESSVGAASSIYLFICGLQEADALQQNSHPAGHTSASAALSQKFLTILRKGSKLGVHTLLWCDTPGNLKKILGEQPLEHFDYRVVFRLPSKEDSIALLGEPSAVELSQERAFFFSGEDGLLEKFRPYDLPPKEWLEWAAAEIRQKAAAK